MTAPLISVRVRGRPPDLHHGKHAHRMQRARVQRERRLLVRALALGARHGAGLPPATERRRLQVVLWWRSGRRDDVNLLQDLKGDIDGLVDAGWLVDDRREWMQLDFPPQYETAETERDVGVEYRLWPTLR